MKREYKKVIYSAINAKNTGMIVRMVKNKKGREFDIINFQIKGTEDNFVDFNCSPEEALQICWGLTKAVYHFLMGFEPYHKFRKKGGKSKFDKKDIWWSI